MLIRRVLAPVDFSARTPAALDYAFALAELAGAEIEVLHVVPAPSSARTVLDAALGRPLPHAGPAQLLEARDRLRDAVEASHRRDLVPYLTVESGDAAATIVRVAAETAADLIVLGTRGHRGPTELVLGSVAQRVITTAGCPVLTLGALPLQLARAHGG